jgi:hypothetical protein
VPTVAKAFGVDGRDGSGVSLDVSTARSSSAPGSEAAAASAALPVAASAGAFVLGADASGSGAAGARRPVIAGATTSLGSKLGPSGKLGAKRLGASRVGGGSTAAAQVGSPSAGGGGFDDFDKEKQMNEAEAAAAAARKAAAEEQNLADALQVRARVCVFLRACVMRGLCIFVTWVGIHEFQCLRSTGGGAGHQRRELRGVSVVVVTIRELGQQ